MDRVIRLVWDFYGGDAVGTAEHHVKHLHQFMRKENLEYSDSGINEMGELHCAAYLSVKEEDVKVLRDALRPNRAFVEKQPEN